ncbi:phage tail tape measure protein [Streptomyces enissocaesilis]
MSQFRRELRQNLEQPVAQSAARAGEQGGESLLSGMGGKMKAGAAGLGLAVGAAMVAGLTEAMEGQKATAKLQAQLGLSAKDAEKAGKAAGKLYTGAVTDTVEDGAMAVRAIMSAGIAPEGATTKQLTAIATKAQDLTTLFEIDMTQGAAAAGQMMKTGLAKNADEAFDILAKGFQTMGPRADDFADTMNEYSTIFRSLGLDAQMATGLISQGMKAGARDTDIVADALKEFQIRATDGSTSSADAFKALGLNAKDMTAQFAAGGKGASDGLGLVLDKLRAMKDPVDRNAAAVGLFGTQAEDLSGALFALDTDTAVAGLGKVGGTAKKAGDDLRNTAGTKFEQFKREALHGISDAMTKYALPALMTFATWMNRDVLPPVKTVGGALASVLVPAIVGVGTALAAGIKWLKDYGVWLLPIGVAVAGLAITMNASAIATGAATLAFSLYRGVILTAAAVTRGYAIAQGILNAVMTANPIGLIITGIAALVTLLVVAYNKSDTFRRIVQATWSGIQFGWDLLWNYYLKPGLTAAMAYLRLLGNAGLWLWNNALKPAFDAIMMAGKILFTVIAVVVIAPLVLAFKLLAATASWLWTNAIKPAFNAIAAAGRWLYAVVLKPAFDNIMTVIKAVGTAIQWLWKNVVSPVFGWIGDKAKWLWSQKIKPAWDLIKTGIGLVGDKIKQLWNDYAKPVFGFIGDKAKWLWDKALKPAFDFMKKGVKAVGDSFRDAKDFIGKQWDKVGDIARKPVRFVIEEVYNAGIVPLWNKIASAFGAPEIKAMALPRAFKSGGILPGYTPGRDPHHFYSPTGGRLDMSGGESIMRPEFTRGAGAGFVHSMNRIAKSRGAEGVRRALAPALGGQPQQRFADGGIFGWIGKKVAGAGSAVWDKAKASASWLADGIEASARAGVKNVVDPLLKSFPGADTGFGKMVRRIPTRMVDSLFGYSKTADKKGGSTLGGKGVKAALSWARTQHGLPYQWGGNGNPSWDCSGFMSAIESIMRGQKPGRRWSTHAFSGDTAPPGWKRGQKAPFMVGITAAGVGHTAGTINGVNVESRGGDGVVVGSRARGYKSSLFTDWYGLRGYAKGGRPRPGEWAWTGENGPELIRFGGPSTVYDSRTSLEMARSAHMTPVPVTSSHSGQDLAQALDGLAIGIVLDDGSQLDAHMDARVDAGLNAARQRRRAGVKGT